MAKKVISKQDFITFWSKLIRELIDWRWDLELATKEGDKEVKRLETYYLALKKAEVTKGELEFLYEGLKGDYERLNGQGKRYNLSNITRCLDLCKQNREVKKSFCPCCGSTGRLAFWNQEEKRIITGRPCECKGYSSEGLHKCANFHCDPKPFLPQHVLVLRKLTIKHGPEEGKRQFTQIMDDNCKCPKGLEYADKCITKRLTLMKGKADVNYLFSVLEGAKQDNRGQGYKSDLEAI